MNNLHSEIFLLWLDYPLSGCKKNKLVNFNIPMRAIITEPIFKPSFVAISAAISKREHAEAFAKMAPGTLKHFSPETIIPKFSN